MERCIGCEINCLQQDNSGPPWKRVVIVNCPFPDRSGQKPTVLESKETGFGASGLEDQRFKSSVASPEMDVQRL